MRPFFICLLMSCLSVQAVGQTGEKPYGDLEGEVALTQTIYTPENGPEAPAVADLPTQKSVSQYGITWTFDREVPVGRFITGDYYVVGPVTVSAIDPAPIQGVENLKKAGWEIIKRQGVDDERYGEKVSRNGSMLNPTGEKIKAGGGKFGFDSRLAHVLFGPKCFEAPPFELKPGDSLISSISNRDLDDFRGYGQPLYTAAVLTCLDKPVPADSFRPSYSDTSNRIYLARNLNRELLYDLPRPAAAPEMEIWIRRFHRPWIDFTTWGYGAPMRNMPRYGQKVVGAVSTVAMMVHLDYPPEQKEKLLVHYVQYGIDIGGLVRSGFDGWVGHGGFGAGRRWSIIFAGLMLGDEGMQRPNSLNPQARFAEVDQTSWGPHWRGEKVLFESHPAWRPDPSEKTHPREWGAGHIQSDNYRIANTSKEWPGQALAARMMRAEALWDHDPFFAYVDRWMKEDIAAHVRTRVFEMAKTKGVDVEKDPPAMPWYVRAQHTSTFHQQLWDKYRDNLPPMKPAMKAWARAEEQASSEQQ